MGGHPANHVSWPIKVKTFQDAEGPLCTIPEPERKSIESVDYVMAGFPGMFVGRVGDADSNAYFG